MARMAVAVRCPKSIPFAFWCAFLIADKSSARYASNGRRLRWKHRRQGVVGSLGDRRINGHWTRRGVRTRVTGVTANNRIKRIEHGDVDDRHGAAGASRSELFSENAVLPRADGSVIEACGIKRDHIPTVKRIESVPRP